MRRATLACLSTAFLWLAACDESSGEDPEAATGCPDTEAAALLTVDNRTGNTMEAFTMRACDGSDLVDFPIPNGGLVSGETLTIELPAPGCWILSYKGDGCFNDPKHQTPAEGVCGGETHMWTADEQAHTCSGAGW
ncbi:MAG: hypothetical protein JKY37_13440 [Nannocystaceae bacterium]|nr:hypothetical protein [Nannocystaceae bacterium]